MLRRKGFIDHHVGGLDDEAAALRHGVAGVGGEIHQHLADLPGIGAHPAQVFGGDDHQFYILAQHAQQQILHLRDDLVQVEDFRFQHLLAAKRQQLAGESGGAIGRLVNFARPPFQEVSRVAPLQHQLAVADDHVEQVVEIVRHAARQPAHGFHLGRLLELHLHTPPLADVAHDGHEAKHLAGIAGDGEHRKLDLFFTAGLGPDA